MLGSTITVSPGYNASSSTSVDALVEDLDIELGRGANGVVYSLKSSADKAVKEIQTDGLTPDMQASLDTELKILPRLRHPNIVEYKRILNAEGYVYIEMKRYAGSLDGVIRTLRHKKKTSSRDMIVNVLRQVGSGLMYLHSSLKTGTDGTVIPPIIHGDLRPANILLNKEETEFVISDFGLCRDGVGGLASMTIPVYMAPEVLAGKNHTAASDMWSLGMIVYELATGNKPPFLGGKAPADVYVSGWKADLDAIDDPVIKGVLAHILVLEPEHRLSAADLVELLNTDGGVSAIATTLRFKALEDEIARLREEVAALRDAMKQKTVPW